MILSYAQVIDGIKEYSESFTARVPNPTLDRWAQLLDALRTTDVILERAIKRCAENDLGPAWSRLRSSIAVERAIDASKRSDLNTGDSQAFESWVMQYRKEGNSSGYPLACRDNDSPATSYETARFCYRVVNNILQGRTKIPYEPCSHGARFVSSCKTCEAFQRWYWAEVENLMHHDEYIAPVFTDEL